MSTSRPFAYNTGSTLPNTEQYGNLAVLTGETLPSGVQWWMGPDEDLGYVIAAENAAGNQPTPVFGLTAFLRFFRTGSFTNNQFLKLANYITNQNFSSSIQAENYLFSNGYWTSFSGGPDQFISVSAGGSHSLSITENNIAFSWGDGQYGKLGNNQTEGKQSTPIAVCGNLPFSQVSAGFQHSLGITTDGIAYAWGRNNKGQLGDEGEVDKSTPVAVFGNLTFSQVSAGSDHSLGITTDGIAYAWGEGLSGQLGDDTEERKPVPVAVCGNLTFSQISAGNGFSLGITTDGIVYGWGSNVSGQLGDDSTHDKSTPVAVCTTLTFIQVSAGDGFSLGITTTGVLYAWGSNAFGQLGDDNGYNKSTPVAVSDKNLQYIQVSAGKSHSLAITTDGTAYAWGRNNTGQLGDNSTVDTSTPVAVCGGLTFSQISAGGDFSLGITTDGIAYGWGSGSNGILGNNSAANQSTPVAVCSI